MELCTARGISNLLSHKPPTSPLHFTSSHIRCIIQCRARFPVHLKQTRFSSGPRYTIVSCLSSTTETTTYEAISPEDKTIETAASVGTETKTTTPEEIAAESTAPVEIATEDTIPEETVAEATLTEANSTVAISDIKDEPASGGAVTVEVTDSPSVEKIEEYAYQDEPASGGAVTVEVAPSVEKREGYVYQPDENPLGDDSRQLLKFLEDFNIKFNYEDKYSILALGVAGLIALRIAAAVVGAIDSIPVLSKVLELVGLGYTIWFTTRFLIFEQNREEFGTRVKQLKEEVIGSETD